MELHYLGPESTFSHEAAQRFAAALSLSGAVLVPQPSIAQILQAVAGTDAADRESIAARLGCIPVENSINGSVTATMDVFRRVAVEPVGQDPVRRAALNLQILASLRLAVEQYLLTLPTAAWSEVEEVVSHAQGLGQCDAWLHEHLPHARQTAVASTAHAAEMVARSGNPRLGAIGSLAAARAHGLIASAASIQMFSGNETRFALIGDARVTTVRPRGERWTLSLLLVRVPNQPGGLLRSLQPFYENGYDISRIESRPVGNRLGEYLFFLDVVWPHVSRTTHGLPAWRRTRAALAKLQVDVIQLGLFPEIRAASD